MRKESRQMPQNGHLRCLTEHHTLRSAWLMKRITLTEPPVGKRKQYDSQGEELKYGRME